MDTPTIARPYPVCDATGQVAAWIRAGCPEGGDDAA